MEKTNIVSKIIGFIIIGFGIFSFYMNWISGLNVEYVTHQTYFAIKEISCLISILIGTLLIK